MNLILMSTPNNSAQWMLFLLNKYSKMFFQGTWLTLYIAVLGTFIGFILGFALGVLGDAKINKYDNFFKKLLIRFFKIILFSYLIL